MICFDVIIMLRLYSFIFTHVYILYQDIPLSIIPTHFHLQRCVKHGFISFYISSISVLLCVYYHLSFILLINIPTLL
jgi:hypothetical protein